MPCKTCQTGIQSMCRTLIYQFEAGLSIYIYIYIYMYRSIIGPGI